MEGLLPRNGTREELEAKEEPVRASARLGNGN